MKTIYVVTYAICGLNITSGVIGSFSSEYAARKALSMAELSLKNSGLEGIINLTVCEFPGMVADPIKIFEEL